jgi:hypothetical protein
MSSTQEVIISLRNAGEIRADIMRRVEGDMFREEPQCRR